MLPECGIALHATPRREEEEEEGTGQKVQYSLRQGERMGLSEEDDTCADTDLVINEIWVCHPETNRSCFAQHAHSAHDL